MVYVLFYSLVKVVPISKKLYLFRLTVKYTLRLGMGLLVLFNVELRFFSWTTSYHQAR